MSELLIVGFTGPRGGLTTAQRRELPSLLNLIKRGHKSHKLVGLHGDCVGGDVEFHEFAKEAGYEMWKMPSTWDNTVAQTDAKSVSEPQRPYARNRELVKLCHRLIGCVPTEMPIERSGTWYTTNYALKQGKMVTIILPDGKWDVHQADSSWRM